MLSAEEIAGLAVVHVAPAFSTYRALSRMTLGQYVPVDRESSSRVVVRFDVCAPAVVSETFDVAVCVHVLEHVDDDRAAMRGLWHMVRSGGVVAIVVPVHEDGSTVEDPTVTDPIERARLFGEPDHRRWYGTDIVDRLTDAGFEVEARLSRDAPETLRRRYGLTTREGLFLCRRIVRSSTSGGADES